MRPLRVCHLSTMTNWGGVERMLADLLVSQAASGPTPEAPISHLLLTSSHKAEIVQPVLDAGVAAYQMRRAGRFDLSAISAAAAWLRAQQVDILHAYNAYANTWGRLLAPLAGCTLITGEHGTVWQTGGGLLALDRLAQRSAAAVIANSRASARMLQLRYGVRPERLRVVANGVAPLPVIDAAAKRASLGFPERYLVGGIGRLDTPKGFEALVDAAALVLRQRDDVHFLLVGGGVLENALRHRLAEHGIEERFTMTGWRSDARELVQCLEVFVNTSIRESSGNALVEAGMAGVPVIAPAIDGVPEVVANGQNGLLLRPTVPARPPTVPGCAPLNRVSLIDDRLAPPMTIAPKELAGAINSLLDDATLREQLGRDGRTRAGDHFSLAQYRAGLEAIYNEVAGDR